MGGHGHKCGEWIGVSDGVLGTPEGGIPQDGVFNVGCGCVRAKFFFSVLWSGAGGI